MIGWVALHSTELARNADDIRGALNEVFAGEFPADREDRGFVVGDVEPESFLVKSLVPGASGLFVVMSEKGSYVDEEEISIRDRSLRRLAEAQRAWFGIDVISHRPNAGDPYAFIGPAIARLAPPDATVLLHPAHRIALRFDAALRARLAAGLSPTSA